MALAYWCVTVNLVWTALVIDSVSSIDSILQLDNQTPLLKTQCRPFSLSVSLCGGLLSIVWPHVIARTKSRRSYACNDLRHTLKRLSLHVIILTVFNQNSPGRTEYYLPPPPPTYAHYLLFNISKHELLWTWLKPVTVVSVMAFWQSRNVRDDYHMCVTLTGFTEAQYFSRNETTHDHSLRIMTYSRSPCL